MSGFWVCRGTKENKKSVFYAQRKCDFNAPMEHGSRPSRDPKDTWGNYKFFLRHVGIRLKPGEGPVFVETARLVEDMRESG